MYVSRAGSTLNMSVCYLPEKPGVVIPPSGLPLLVHVGTCGGTRGRLGQVGHFSYPTSPPGNIGTAVGLRHHQDVRMTDTGAHF